MKILLKRHPQVLERFLRRKPHQIHQSPTSVSSVQISLARDQLHTLSERHVLFVAILKQPEEIKLQSFLQRIAHTPMLTPVDPVGPRIAPFASCVVLSLMKPPWKSGRNV